MHRYRSRALVVGLVAAGIGLWPAAAQGAQWIGPSLADGQRCTTIDGGCTPLAAVDRGGKTLLAWTDIHGTEDSYATVRTAGGTWQATVNLTAIAAADGFDLDILLYVGLSDTGDAIAYGESADGDVIELWRRPPQGWDSRRVADSASGAAVWSAGALGTGDAKVSAWVRESGGTWRIQARTGTSSIGGYSSVATIATGAGEAPPVRAVVDGLGNSYVVWNEGDAIRMARRAAGGAWAAAATIGTGSQTEIRANRRGDVIVGAMRGNGLNVLVRPAATGVWSDVGLALARGSLPEVSDAAIALGEAGETAATWSDRGGPGGQYRTIVAEHQGGAIWTTTTVPVGFEPLPYRRWVHDIAYDGRGGLVLGWLRTNPEVEGTFETYAVARMAGGDWTPVRKISDYGWGPAIVADGLGNTVVSSTGPEHTVWDAAGPRIISRTIPSSGQTGSPITFSVNTQETWTGQNGPSEWYFGDGTSATGASVGHAYAAPGVYTVTVLQRDGIGNVSSDSANVTITAAPGSGPLPPSPVLPPAISGSDIAGSTLTCLPGSWSAGASVSAPTWIVAGAAVATGTTYVIRPLDVGKVVSCQVTATNAVGSTRATSAFLVPRPGLSAPTAVTPETVAPPLVITAGTGPTTARLGTAARGKRVQVRARVNGALRVSPVILAPRSGVVALPAAWRGTIASPAQWRIAPGAWRKAGRTTARGVEQTRLSAPKGTRVQVVEKVGRRTRTRLLTAGPRGRVVLLKAAAGGVTWRTAPGPWRAATLA